MYIMWETWEQQNQELAAVNLKENLYFLSALLNDVEWNEDFQKKVAVFLWSVHGDTWLTVEQFVRKELTRLHNAAEHLRDDLKHEIQEMVSDLSGDVDRNVDATPDNDDELDLDGNLYDELEQLTRWDVILSPFGEIVLRNVKNVQRHDNIQWYSFVKDWNTCFILDRDLERYIPWHEPKYVVVWDVEVLEEWKHWFIYLLDWNWSYITLEGKDLMKHGFYVPEMRGHVGELNHGVIQVYNYVNNEIPAVFFPFSWTVMPNSGWYQYKDINENLVIFTREIPKGFRKDTETTMYLLLDKDGNNVHIWRYSRIDNMGDYLYGYDLNGHTDEHTLLDPFGNIVVEWRIDYPVRLYPDESWDYSEDDIYTINGNDYIVRKK